MVSNSGDKVVCTIVSKNYLHYARTLMQSFQRTHPDWARHVLLVDEIDGRFDPAAESFTLHTLDDLPLPQRRQFLFRYDILELNTAVKPWFLERLFGGGTQRVIYLDPDVYVYRRLAEVEALLDNGGFMALTPHLTGELEDSHRPSEHDILKAGSYNLGFVALARHPQLERFLKWWQSKLEFDCRVSIAENLFVDQRWMDLAPGLFEDVKILRHAGYNVAYWNLRHRNTHKAPGGFKVNGVPLVFFHFSGLDINEPRSLSKHQDRFRLRELPAVAALVRDYVAANRANGAAVCRTWPYAFGFLSDGSPISAVMRQFYRSQPALRDVVGSDPFAHSHDYLNRPWGTRTQPLVTCLMRHVWESRGDLQSAFPDIDVSHRIDFARWFVDDHDIGVNFADRFLAPVRESIAANLAAGGLITVGGWAAASLAEQSETSAGARGVRILLRWAVFAVPFQPTHDQLRTAHRVVKPIAGRLPRWLRLSGFKADIRRWLAEKRSRRVKRCRQPGASLVQIVGKWLKGLLTKKPLAPALTRREGQVAQTPTAAEPIAEETSVPVNVAARDYVDVIPFRRPGFGGADGFGMDIVGYVRSEHGIGESVRLSAAAARVAQIPFTLHDFKYGNLCRTSDRTWDDHIVTERRHHVAVLHINADQIPAAREALGRNFFKGGYTVGFWHWELPVFPEQWISSFSLVDEIWVPSQFVAEAVQSRSHCPVVKIPHAISFQPDPSTTRDAFGLPRDRFLFLAMYDVLSTHERKNPAGAIAAYRAAFPKVNWDAALVIKINNPEFDRRAVSALKAATKDRADIIILDRIFTRQDVYNLESVCDVFISLHRSEGYGLGLAESMFLGKPVVATDWSGNRDFMNADNSCPVEYRLVRIERDIGPYSAGQIWAEPDVSHAASYLKPPGR